MSDPVTKKLPKKKKREVEAISKAIISKLPLHKKDKKKGEESPSDSPKKKPEEKALVVKTETMNETVRQREEFPKAHPEAEVTVSENVQKKKEDEVKKDVEAAVEKESKEKVEEKKEMVKLEEEKKEMKLEEEKREESVKTEDKEIDEGPLNSSPKAPQIKSPSAHNNIKKECLYKILVIGELGTGKTSIIKRYVHQFFSQHYRATIGVDFALKVLNWDQNTIIRLQLWDIAGQERFGNMTRVYYKEAVGAFIVFDVTRASTFDAVVKWKQDLDAKVQLPDGSPIPCVLLANKCDQQKEGIVNNPNKMNEYCEEHKFTGWFETSAKENINIEEAAKTLVDQIVRNDSSNENGRSGIRDTSKFPLESTEDFSEGKSCAC